MSISDSSADVRDFGSQAARDLRGFLVLCALRRFGHGKLPLSDAPSQAQARRAVEFDGLQDGGGLLSVVCDLWGMSIGDVARASGLDQVVLSSYAMRRIPLSGREAASVREAVYSMISERASRPQSERPR